LTEVVQLQFSKVFCILYLIHCQKVSCTSVVMAVGMWGYMPVRITGVLVFKILFHSLDGDTVHRRVRTKQHGLVWHWIHSFCWYIKVRVKYLFYFICNL